MTGHYEIAILALLKVASITEAKNQLSALVARVRRGETVLITDRGRPVARLEPLGTEPVEGDEARLARLERQGIIRRGRPSRKTRQLILSPPPKTIDGTSIVEIVLQERREGR